MRAALVSLILAMIVSVASAQTGTATATTCSIANTGSNVTGLTIQCGIGKAQGQKIIDLLNQILKSEDIASINAKLDYLLIAASRLTVENNGTISQQNSGGCNQQVVGGNNNTTNCIPPSRHLTPSQDLGLKSLAAQIPTGCQVRFNSADNGESQNYEKELHDSMFGKDDKDHSVGWGVSWHPKVTTIVRVKTADDPCATYALSLTQGIINLGIATVQPELNDNLPAKTVEILVGEQ